MKSLLTLVAFASLAGAETPIAFTRYDDPNPLATMHRSGIRNENIVMNKVDATDAGLQQLGRQLYALTSGDIAAGIGIYTNVWAATNGSSLEDMSRADQLRFGKAWVGMFHKRGDTYTLEYALGGMFKGAGDDMKPQNVKTLQFP